MSWKDMQRKLSFFNEETSRRTAYISRKRTRPVRQFNKKEWGTAISCFTTFEDALNIIFIEPKKQECSDTFFHNESTSVNLALLALFLLWNRLCEELPLRLEEETRLLHPFTQILILSHHNDQIALNRFAVGTLSKRFYMHICTGEEKTKRWFQVFLTC